MAPGNSYPNYYQVVQIKIQPNDSSDKKSSREIT